MTAAETFPTPKACCSPARSERPAGAATIPDSKSTTPLRFSKVEIPGGKATMGTGSPLIKPDGEAPLRTKKLKPFRIGTTTVTNAEFAAFVTDTGYTTDAERFGWSFVFWSDVDPSIGTSQAVEGSEWWRRIDGANWRDINGPGSQEAAFKLDHPVVHVSWRDAQAFAKWAGGRLPTEAEWEHAARGGLGDVRFPWGNEEPNDTSHLPCNIWQGRFPQENSGADGWKTTAPARSFEPNGFGLFNMAGNVWEWTVDVYKVKSLKKNVRARLQAMRGFRVLKGGSFLCHKSYCYRYRIAARTGNSPESTTTHQGFRVVWEDPV